MGAREAGAEIERLLCDHPDYRRAWQQHSVRGTGSVNRAAVCQVLADYLWESGERPESLTDLPRRLRDLVGRSLDGAVLTHKTLTWFCEAFDFAPADRARLTALLTDTPTTRVYAGSRRAGTPRANSLRTLSLHEHHYVGADGRPSRHETIQVVEAQADGVDRLRYAFDTNTVNVTATQGGTPSELRRVDDSVSAVDIVFHRPLNRGETTTLRYVTDFDHRTTPKPEFRREAMERITNLNLRVEFDQARLPVKVQFAVWPAVGRPIIESRLAPLDPDGSVNRYLTSIESVVVGFRWRFAAEG